MQTYVSIGTAVLSAILGRKVASSTTVGRAATSMRSASRASRQQADVVHAEEALSDLEEKLATLEEEVGGELERIRLEANPDRLVLESIEISPKKTEISVDDVVLAWVPAVESFSVARGEGAATRRPWGGDS
jgi:molybdopterin converting factor small subunit